jgi:hypothetical protein
MTPEICPNCGAEVPRKAKSCPECGADEQTGWSDEAHASGLDLPDDNFDYNEFVKREFEGGGAVPRGVRWYWWVIALAMAGLLLAWWLR